MEVMMKKSLGAKTLLFPTPVLIIGSYDQEGKSNLMAVAWGGICCSKPPCVAISLREATYTYHNIKSQKAFTVNITPENYIKEADYFGIASGKNINKFNQSGLTPVKSTLVNAPYIDEWPIILECQLIQTHPIGLHTLFVGEILDVKADEQVVGEKKYPQMEKIKPAVFSPGERNYYGIGSFLGKAFSIGKELK